MGALDTALPSVAKQLLAQFGTLIVLRQMNEGEYNTTTGRRERTSRDRVVKGLFEPYKARFALERSASGARGSDLQVTIAALQDGDPDLFRAPSETDRVVLGDWVNHGTDALPDIHGGQVHEIIHVDPVYSGEAVALYVLHVKR